MDSYEIIRSKYVRRRQKKPLFIYARTLKTAEVILAIENTDAFVPYRPSRFGFMKKLLIEEPPYEFELLQAEYAEKRLEARRKVMDEFQLWEYMPK